MTVVEKPTDHDAVGIAGGTGTAAERVAGTRRGRSRKGLYLSYAMIAVPFALLLLFGIYPFLQGLVKAFYNYNGGRVDRFNGIDNFVKIASDPKFWTATRTGLLLMAVAAAQAVLIPLVVAWLVHHFRSSGAKYLFRILVMLPVVVPGVISLMVWKYFLRKDGILNTLLGSVGLGGLQENWLADPDTVVIGLILVGIPWLSGINCLLYLGAFAAIPREIYEAAQIDGAGRFRILRSVELPYVSAQTKIIGTLAIIGGLQGYEHIMILTGGGPNEASTVPGLLLFRNAFRYSQYGYASAIAVVIMIITLAILGVAYLVTRLRRNRD